MSENNLQAGDMFNIDKDGNMAAASVDDKSIIGVYNDDTIIFSNGSFIATTGTSGWSTTFSDTITIPIKREKHEIKCSECGKVLTEVYSYGEVDSVYCELCHKIEKLKE